MKKEIGVMKECVLFAYLMPLGAAVVALDLCGDGATWIYKSMHAAAGAIARHIQEIMDKNNLT